MELPAGSYVVGLSYLDRKSIDLHVIIEDPGHVQKLEAVMPEVFPLEYAVAARFKAWASVLAMGSMSAAFTWAGVDTGDRTYLGIGGAGWGVTLLGIAVLWKLYHPASAEVQEHVLWTDPPVPAPRHQSRRE